MTPMGETGNERERHSSTASSNSPYASGSSERARGNGSSTSLVPSGLSSGPPSDMMSQGPDGHKIDDEREDNEPADSGIEKSSLSKRKRSIGQRPDSGSRTKRRKTSGTNSEAATRLEENDARRKSLEQALLTHYEKEQMQIKDYGETEMPAFEEIRKAFQKSNKARSVLGAQASWEILRERGERDIPFQPPRKKKSSTGPGLLAENGTAADENGDSEPESNDLSATEKEDEANSVGTKNEDTLAKEDIVTRWKMPIGVYHPVPLERTLVEALKESLRVPPRFLYRASSTEGRKHTNGSDKLSLHRPAADVNKSEMCHATIYEIPNGLGELLEMLGHRFLWLDRRRDETLSWTSSLLFAIVHATGRLAKKQRGVKIHVIDTTKVTTTKGQPVEFHFAPDLLRILDIQSFRGWDRFQITNLRQPWYTHEWISHHVVQSPKEHSYEAKIEDLLDAGLYAFLGSLKTPERRDMRSLYHRCCYSRSLEHVISGALKPITVEEIEASKRLALCFKSPNNHTPEPSINFLIDFLGLTARPKENPALIEWIKKRYIAEDLLNAAYENVVRVANNTPELAQALDLAREACMAFGLPKVPDTRVWVADPEFNWYCKWLPSTRKQIKIRSRKRKIKFSISGQQPSTSEQARAQDVLDDHDTAGEEAAKDDGEGSLTLSASEDDGSADDVDLEDEISSSADEMAMVHID
ncbi:hypothetical protein D0864_06916 [Hortaea werneckii]|uniref:Uncharacterized protein n=1 Tax=Hortaea werneckii TaxID=91943 RepID=A0A3M7FEB6_HORWE|nr:hypothetical protein KC352_g13821 [Hortaea werneckii]KAI7352185.1 hypothetical protein KC320_g4604 [Hortaea werneckii]KAI7564714.1 hypothetical protein KC317_g6865 [Hortaea werneckii]KAI7615309.1 hypothetical protein KC346_g6519 [Hortaea werneckii]RMY87152.1 hypothetical protein D0864_06916 [Hortaea werneckii]